MKIDYKSMSEYYVKSVRTLKKWEIDKPQKFELMLDEFNKNSKNNKNNYSGKDAEVIVCTSLKGGVGKSTLSNILGYYLDDAIILNVDISQSCKEVNACKTLDYYNVMNKYSIREIVDLLSKKYKHIIIDTPGGITTEVKDSVEISNKMIIPMTTGKATRKRTMKTLEAFFGKGTNLKGKYKLFFFFNNYKTKSKKDNSSALFKKEYETFIKSKKDDKIEFSSKLGSLDYSDAIYTAEEKGKSIIELAREMPVAYKPFLSKINKLCGEIEIHLIDSK